MLGHTVAAGEACANTVNRSGRALEEFHTFFQILKVFPLVDVCPSRSILRSPFASTTKGCTVEDGGTLRVEDATHASAGAEPSLK
jgi:hypothetical protein